MMRLRKEQTVKCPICEQAVRITPAQRGTDGGHAWVWDLAHAQATRQGIKYPLSISCPQEAAN